MVEIRALTGNQAVNGDNNPQPVAFGETGLLDPNILGMIRSMKEDGGVFNFKLREADNEGISD